MSGAYEDSNLAEDTRKRVNDLDYGAEAIKQLAICIPKVFERRFSLLKQSKDVLGCVASPESVGGGLIGEVYSGLFGIAVQSSIEDRPKVIGGGSRRKHVVDEIMIHSTSIRRKGMGVM